MAIDGDLPEVTVFLKSGKSSTLETCPKRITDGAVMTDLFNDTSATTVEDFFKPMADDLGVDTSGDVSVGKPPFPYCSWWGRINTKVYETKDYTKDDTPVVSGMNIFLPDSSATYWAMPFIGAQDSKDPVDHYEIKGKFQQQLFMSYVLYDSNMDFYYYKNSAGTICQSYNNDYQIAPDSGSVNPWRQQSTDYTGTYTLELTFDPRDKGCSGGGPQHEEAGTNANVLSLSRTDSGYGPDNTGQNVKVQGEFFGEGADASVPRASNGCAYTGADTRPCSLPGMFVAPTPLSQNSVWSNPVAGYLASVFVPKSKFVYVFRGKAPRTPSGDLGESPVPWQDDGSSDYDMRYYSLCVDRQVWPFQAEDANWSCANGSFGSGEYNKDTNPDGLTQLAVGDDGYWTLIVSSEEPSKNVGNATFLKVDEDQPLAIVMRNMVVQNSFKTSVPFIDRDGAWTTAWKQMADYYGVETVICNQAQFEKYGWDLDSPGCFVPQPNTGS